MFVLHSLCEVIYYTIYIAALIDAHQRAYEKNVVILKRNRLLNHRYYMWILIAPVDTARIYMMEPAHRKALVYKVSFIKSLTCNSLPLIDELQEESNEGYFGIVDRRYSLRACWN